MNTNLKGNIALGKAIAYFTEQEFIVNLPLNDSQCYDFIIEKNGKMQTVQVKYTSEQAPSGNYVCHLRTVSGTTRTSLYNITDTYCDLLFCYCSNGDKFLIPVKEINNNSTLTLYREKSKFASKNTMDSSQYLIELGE